MNTVRHNLKALRLKKGMTQDDLAERLHVVRQTVSSWETGKTEPGIDTLMEIAEALSVDATELLYGPRPQTPFERERPRRKRRAWILGAAFLLLTAATLAVTMGIPPWYEAKTGLEWGWGDRGLWLFWARSSAILPQLCCFLFPAAALSIAAVFRDLRVSPAWLRWGLLLLGAAMMAFYLILTIAMFRNGSGIVSGFLLKAQLFLYSRGWALFLLPGVPFALGLNR